MTARRALAVAAAVVVALACATGAVILDRADVQDLQVVQTPPAVAQEYSLQITGVVGNSELAFSRHYELRHGTDTIQVLVELAPARADLSRSFDFVVFVPKDITHVAFGDKLTPIWRRP